MGTCINQPEVKGITDHYGGFARLAPLFFGTFGKWNSPATVGFPQGTCGWTPASWRVYFEGCIANCWRPPRHWQGLACMCLGGLRQRWAHRCDQVPDRFPTDATQPVGTRWKCVHKGDLGGLINWVSCLDDVGVGGHDDNQVVGMGCPM